MTSFDLLPGTTPQDTAWFHVSSGSPKHVSFGVQSPEKPTRRRTRPILPSRTRCNRLWACRRGDKDPPAKDRRGILWEPTESPRLTTTTLSSTALESEEEAMAGVTASHLLPRQSQQNSNIQMLWCLPHSLHFLSFLYFSYLLCTSLLYFSLLLSILLYTVNTLHFFTILYISLYSSLGAPGM